MSIIGGIIFAVGTSLFTFAVAMVRGQFAVCSICCACGSNHARQVMILGEYDAVEEARLCELLTENCPNCRHRRTNPHSTIDNPQSREFSHVG